MRSERVLSVFAIVAVGCARAESAQTISRAPESHDAGTAIDARSEVAREASYEVVPDRPYGSLGYGKRPWTLACATLAFNVVWLAMDDEIAAIDLAGDKPARRWPFATKDCALTARTGGDGAFVVRRHPQGIELLALETAHMPRRLALVDAADTTALWVEHRGDRVQLGTEGSTTSASWNAITHRLDVTPRPKEPWSASEHLAQITHNRCVYAVPKGETLARVLCAKPFTLAGLPLTERGPGHEVYALLPSTAGVWMIRGSDKTGNPFFAHHEVVHVVSDTAASP